MKDLSLFTPMIQAAAAPLFQEIKSAKQLNLSQEIDTEEYVLASREELEEVYSLPSAFEAYRKVIMDSSVFQCVEHGG